MVKTPSKTNGTVILPMQPNLSETNSISWGGNKANAIQLKAGELAINSMKRYFKYR